jgi:hypothetical protein
MFAYKVDFETQVTLLFEGMGMGTTTFGALSEGNGTASVGPANNRR